MSDDPRTHPAARALARRSPALLPALLLLALAACGDGEGGGGGPVEPPPAEPPRETCAAVVRLAVGEAAPLSADEQGRVRCRVDGGDGAEFAVAFVDTRAARKAQTGPEGYGEAFGPYVVSVSTGGLSPQTTRGGAGAAGGSTPEPHLLRAEMAAAPPEAAGVLRDRPWTVGERFALYDGLPRAPRTARVLRIYDGHFVVAWFEGDNEALLPRYLERLDSAWAGMRSHALPLMGAAYSEDLPRTSPGSGQFLVVLRAEGRGDAWGWVAADRSLGGEPRLWAELKVMDLGALRLLELLSHEMAHAFQALYMFRTRPVGFTDSAAGATFWATEGGADLVSFETVRRLAGAGLTQNFDARAPGTAEPARRLAQWAHPAGGVLSDGYASAAGFLRTLAARRALAGESPDPAVGEVLRGAAEGWHGTDSYGARRQGLTERMRALLGTEWTPEEALLDWALSHAADDRTASARYQDPTFLRAGEAPPFGHSWQPMARMSGNGTEMASTTRGYGSPHFLLLSGQGEMVLSAAADVPGVRWKVLRVR